VTAANRNGGGPAGTARLVDAVDDLLPQTQCTRCGFPDCRAYAAALARGATELNRCAPGGEPTIRALARLLGRPALPPDPAVGSAAMGTVAVIDEAACIGCTLCLPACPVDAIVGAPGQAHTVLPPECTGCELCPPACPVDCIRLVTIRAQAPTRDDPQAARRARERYRLHCERRRRRAEERAARRELHTPGADAGKAAAIRAAVERVRARRAARRRP